MSGLGLAGGLGLAVLPVAVAAESAGVPLPGEATLVAAALLASQGHFDIAAVIGLAALGAIVGDNIGYVLGRRLGRPALVARGPARGLRLRALDAAGALFDRYGGRAVFAGRFAAVGRIAVAWLAGAERMPWSRFAAWNVAGSLCWASLVGGVTYFAGSAGAHWVAILGVVILVLTVLPVVRGRGRRPAGEDPAGAPPHRPFIPTRDARRVRPRHLLAIAVLTLALAGSAVLLNGSGDPLDGPDVESSSDTVTAFLRAAGDDPEAACDFLTPRAREEVGGVSRCPATLRRWARAGVVPADLRGHGARVRARGPGGSTTVVLAPVRVGSRPAELSPASPWRLDRGVPRLLTITARRSSP